MIADKEAVHAGRDDLRIALHPEPSPSGCRKKIL